MTQDYDALLIVSFGGPKGMDDVMPFLENVLRGRNVPRERMLEVARRYELFGGVSPINEQNRKLLVTLKQELKANGPQLSIYWGNRNWHPLLAETLRKMRDDGVKQALAFVTSAYSSYSSCRQYLEDIKSASEQVGPDAPHVDKIRAFYNHPLFIQANAETVSLALGHIPEVRRPQAQLVFTAHSIPQAMADNCDYQAQLQETARLVAENISVGAELVSARDTHFSLAAGRDKAYPYKLVYQSRSGLGTEPWLGPDIQDHLKELKSAGATDVVVAPIGFISDHMEIVYDLDTEARALCEQLDLNMIRAATVGTQPAFVSMIRELILERLEPVRERRFLGTHGPANEDCPPECCAPR